MSSYDPTQANISVSMENIFISNKLCIKIKEKKFFTVESTLTVSWKVMSSVVVTSSPTSSVSEQSDVTWATLLRKPHSRLLHASSQSACPSRTVSFHLDFSASLYVSVLCYYHTLCYPVFFLSRGIRFIFL